MAIFDVIGVFQNGKITSPPFNPNALVPYAQPIEMVQGEALIIRMYCQNNDGTGLDITNWEFECSLQLQVAPNPAQAAPPPPMNVKRAGAIMLPNPPPTPGVPLGGVVEFAFDGLLETAFWFPWETDSFDIYGTAPAPGSTQENFVPPSNLKINPSTTVFPQPSTPTPTPPWPYVQLARFPTTMLPDPHAYPVNTVIVDATKNVPLQNTGSAWIPLGASGDIVATSLSITPTTPTEILTIYVRPTGNDTTGDGTLAKPYRTVQHALDTIPILQRGVRYIVDITGINDTNQDIHFPPYSNSDGLGTDPTPPNAAMATLGYVTVRAVPTVLYTLNFATTSGVDDPISLCTTVEDSSANWVPDQWKGKFLVGSLPFQGAVITGNDATHLFTAGFSGGAQYPFVQAPQILDVGASLTSAGPFQAPIHIDGVRAPIIFQGIHIPSAGVGAGCVRSDSYFDYIATYLCSIGEMQIRSGGGSLDHFFTFIQGHGGGVQGDWFTACSQWNFQECYMKDSTPSLPNDGVFFTFTILENVRLFDQGGSGSGCSVFFQLGELHGQGLLVNSGMSVGIIDMKFMNAIPVAHVNQHGSGIHVFGDGELYLAEGAIGGSGNAGYGIEVDSGGTVWTETGEPVTLTLTGALGDIKVGNNPPRTIADFFSGASGLPTLNEVDPGEGAGIYVNLPTGPSGIFGTGNILWTFGQQTWAQIVTLIKAVNARGGEAVVYLDAPDFSGDTFIIDTPANLDRAILKSASPVQVSADFTAGFQLLGTRLRLEGISAFTEGTMWTNDLLNPRELFVEFRRSAVNPSPGAPAIFVVGNASVTLFESSYLQGDNPPGHAAFALQDGGELIAQCYSQSNFDGTMAELAAGAVAAQLFVDYDGTCIDESSFYPFAAGITVNLQSTAGSLPPHWQDATLLNGWAAFGAPGATPGYYFAPDGRVQLRGWLAGGASGTVAFQLPLFLVPEQTIQFPVTTDSAHLGIVQIDPSGNVTIFDVAGGASASIMTTLDSISFYNT